ncbi:hypothetical protein WDU94_007743 [Cyamophila willieti]
MCCNEPVNIEHILMKCPRLRFTPSNFLLSSVPEILKIDPDSIKITGLLTPISLTEDPDAVGESPLSFNWDIGLSSKADATLLAAFVDKQPISPRLKEAANKFAVKKSTSPPSKSKPQSGVAGSTSTYTRNPSTLLSKMLNHSSEHCCQTCC